MRKLTGHTLDISRLLRFFWYQEVYLKLEDNSFPSESPEVKGRIVGIAENVGHALSYCVLHEKTGRILCQSTLRAITSDKINKRANLISGEDFLSPHQKF